MSKNWPTIRLGDVLQRSQRTIDLQPEATYREVTVKLWGKGVVLRGTVTGAEIASSRRFAARAGQFIFSRIDARNGALGIVPPELDGAVVTNDFPLFDAIPERIDIGFLAWLARTPAFVELCRRASVGTTNRVRLQEDRFLGLPVVLPPLPEQRRIVARIGALATQIEAARCIKLDTKSTTDSFWKVLSRIARGTAHPVRRLEEMVEFLDGKRIPLSETERSMRKGQYPYYGASGIIDYIDGYLFDEPLVLLSEDGANLINRSTPIAFIASGKYWVNNHAHVLKPLRGVADLRFLAYALSDYDVSTFNYASAQAKLNQKNARKIEFSLPPVDEQRRIVAELDLLQSEINTLKRLQSETADELGALLPAVLDRAFRGEL